VRQGHSVAVLDDCSTGREHNLKNVRDRIDFFRGSVTDRETLKRACKGVHFAIHLAAQTSVPRSVEDPIETNRVNVDGTLQVLSAAREAGVTRVVFSGSSAVYGDNPILPKREAMSPAPISPYGISKLVGEMYGQLFSRTYSLQFVTLRYFNVFGPRQDPSSPYSGVLSRFIESVRKGVVPTVFGDGDQSRDFTFVDDAVAANLRACETPDISGMVFNVGTGRLHTLNQTLKLLERFSGRPIEAKYLDARAGDIRSSQADISVARTKLGFEPRVEFQEGLRRTWDWFNGNDSM
jgi:UDP-glucose 4-epimerase